LRGIHLFMELIELPPIQFDTARSIIDRPIA